MQVNWHLAGLGKGKGQQEGGTGEVLGGSTREAKDFLIVIVIISRLMQSMIAINGRRKTKKGAGGYKVCYGQKVRAGEEEIFSVELYMMSGME